jgi:hypothetical protein
MDLYAGAAFLERNGEDLDWMAHPSARPFVQGYFENLYEHALDYGVPAMADIALAVGSWLGFSVAPPPEPGAPPTSPPADSGMTNTMPDINSPLWQLQQNGLKTWDVVTGTGDPVVAGDSITVFYTGWLASNGTVFDSRRSPANPVTFQLNNLIEGWKQGIPGMRNGGIRRLFVPSAIGYGQAGSPPNIPPNADLVFEIKVISHT